MNSSFIRILILFLVLGRLVPASANNPKAVAMKPGWVKSLRKRLAALDAAYPGELGVYVKDLDSGVEFSHRAEESWYLASGVKVPIAVEVLRQIEAGRYALDTTVALAATDFVDGAGGTNKQAPGSILTVRYLLEQMLIHSDNTASDLLIGLSGLKQINHTVQTMAPAGFSAITSLADVRRHAYSAFHTSASRLTNADLVQLKAISDERLRVMLLARILQVPEAQFNSRTLDAAFNAYYAERLNSAPLRSYGLMLEAIAQDQFLQPSNTQYLLQLMERAETGKSRIRAGLPPSTIFAHKTGTQHARFCDFGIARPKNDGKGRRVVIAACSRGERSLEIAELALKGVGQAVAESGILD